MPIKRQFPHQSSQRIRFPLAPGDPGLQARRCGTTGEGGAGPCAPPRGPSSRRGQGKLASHGSHARTAQLDSPTPTCKRQPPCARPQQSQCHVESSTTVTTTTRPLGAPADRARVQLWGRLPGRRECPSEMQRMTPPACLGAWIQLFLKKAQVPKPKSCPHAYTNLSSIRTPATEVCPLLEPVCPSEPGLLTVQWPAHRLPPQGVICLRPPQRKVHFLTRVTIWR